jgi:8-hydroxy-5-deazaflavin:NADPH oxidoreductase
MAETLRIVGVLGGTGALGRGLGFRLAHAGYSVLLGSRDQEKSKEAARELSSQHGLSNIAGASNKEVAEKADLVIVAVPFVGRDQVLTEIRAGLAGKIVVDATVPLLPPKVSVVHLRPSGSAAVEMQQLLGPEVRVVSAFQNVAAAKLKSSGPIDCDVLVCCDDKAAKEQVVAMIERIGLNGLDAGVLANAVVAEALTSVLIGINRRHKAEAGIRITGISKPIAR